MKILKAKEYPRVGDVLYRYSPRARVVNITVKPWLPVMVSVPRGMKIRDAEKTFLKSEEWVLKEQKKMAQVEKKFTLFDFGDVYKVKDRTIKIKSTPTPNYVVEKPDGVDIFIYEEVDPKAIRDIQSFIHEIIEEEMRLWCKKGIPGKVMDLANRHQFKVEKVIIRSSASRWASLGKTGNLNISLFLALLPDHLIEYVILHEFAHVKVKDHSKRYWDHLATFCPGALKLEKELKGHVIGVI